MKTTLYAKYYDEHRQLQLATATVYPRSSWAKHKHYPYVYLVFDSPDKISKYDYFESKDSAKEWLQRAVRLVTFVNASGLRPVKRKKAHQEIAVPDWADHQTYWLDEFGNAFILIEPMEHAQAYLTGLNSQQFTYQLVPRPLSPYHTPANTDAFSMLLTTPRNKGRLAVVIARLELAAGQAGALS